jgi:hypothetical protein
MYKAHAIHMAGISLIKLPLLHTWQHLSVQEDLLRLSLPYHACMLPLFLHSAWPFFLHPLLL